ncbi:MAG: TauD/TfdA family dioxygenase [Rhodospirillaceae bacterium]|nr:TauD/TfdA family dioxygenase [Rhodospirillaceae bacterium]MBT5895231.1 TauD/TfdA family dioxygenase [Rhodospirillaceae bacterium]MBT6426985.1 TauD/TfdA family dioxygenase [Rhodospirillaceae bacterium]MBT7760529.1 TauD/TfdA family dioxygenase [Rhodospirillaceae bacterium]
MDAAIKPFDHPAAWKATDFTSKADLTVALDGRHLSALEAGLAALKSETREHARVTPEIFPLDGIADDIAAWREEVHRGRGIVMLSGFPVADIEAEDMRLMYLGFGSHFGRPTSQSPLGDLIGDVVNIGGNDKQERAYRSSRRLSLHTDRCDHLAMLCIRPAASGGLSGYASGLTAHNIMLEERPDLVEVLYRGYHHHRFGQQAPGEPLVTEERVPIFSIAEGVPSTILIRGYIDLAVQEGHVQLSDIEAEALDFLESVTEREDVKLELMMAPGELIVANNCLLLHNRSEFKDADDAARKRLLLRLWLREDGRPMSSGVQVHKGQAGIDKQDGKGTYYTPDADAS